MLKAFICHRNVYRNSFRCNFGACIDLRKKCNERTDCADGSDEDTTLCSNVITMTENPPINNRPPGKTTQKPPRGSVTYKPPKTGSNSSSGCVLPNQPKNGVLMLDKSLCSLDEDCNPPVGTKTFPPGVRINYRCNLGTN